MTLEIKILTSENWQDYELLDCGEGQKLERFGNYIFARPEVEAMWRKTLSAEKWNNADAAFLPSSEESGGHWKFRSQIPDKWEMNYGKIKFWAQTTHGRHLGVFPEGAVLWDWMGQLIQSASMPVKVLNLFGYTGLATLTAAEAGAEVTHVDASKKAIIWARENQSLSSLNDKPVRWLVDDALKFVQREIRRGNKYHGLIIDPPKFGRGPKGEVWELYKTLPNLLQACNQVLDSKALFTVITVYAVKASSLHIRSILEEVVMEMPGIIESGELVTRERSGNHLLSNAVFARWKSS